MDISKREKLQESYISDIMQRVFTKPQQVDSARAAREMVWIRNILYYLGEQWLTWAESTRTFGRIYDIIGNIPTPVSNIIRDYVRSMKALILNRKYVMRVWPNSMERKDIDAADLGDKMLRWLHSLNDNTIEELKEWAALWTVTVGNAFLRTYPESDDSVYVLGAERHPISKGSIATECIIPFNVEVGILGTELSKKSFIGIKSLKSKEWVEDTYKIVVQNPTEMSQQLDFERYLLKLVSEVSPWKGRGFSDTDLLDMGREDLTTFYEIEFAPTKEFPRGRYYLQAGSAVIKGVEGMVIPVDQKTGAWEYSLVHFRYNPSHGSFWGTGGIDDLISPQNSINEIDQALAVNRKSLGRPIVLSPTGLTLKRLSNRGQALLAVEYDARASGGAKPELRDGLQYPQQILQERENHKQVSQDAAGDPKNILRGQAPSARASGVMVDSLRESAEMSHTPDIDRFYRKWAQLGRKQLMIAQSFFTEERILKVPGQGNRIFVKAFRGSELYNNTDVRTELDNSLSSTLSGRNQLMVQLISGGLFDKLAGKPRLLRDILKKMGLGTLPDEENLHQDIAERENSVFTYGKEEDLKTIALPDAPMGEAAPGVPIRAFPKSYDPTFPFHNHLIHQRVHLEHILSAEFPALDRSRQMWAIGHLELHNAAIEAIDEQNAQRMASRAAMGAIEPGGSPAAPSAGGISDQIPIEEGGGMAGVPFNPQEQGVSNY